MRTFRYLLLLFLALPAGAAAAAEAPAPAPAEKKKEEKTVPPKTKADDPKEKAAANLAPPPLSPRFIQVRERIQALYGNRDAPPPPLDPRYNPLRTAPVSATAATAVPRPAGATAEPAVIAPPASSNAALLKQATALLKVTGFVVRDGRTLLNINQGLYKEGDVIKVAVKNSPVLLRIKKLTRTSLTLSLEDAETTLNF